ncbi:MAG: hypothetical protein J5742_01940 [Alphaproteobacteria bacterium]|nr:hypothetical protein [Alphaproteobacteria bacterium]
MKKSVVFLFAVLCAFAANASALDEMYAAQAASEAAAEAPYYQNAREMASEPFDGPSSGDGYTVYTGYEEFDGAPVNYDELEDVQELNGSTDFFSSSYDE